jgi:hypothetical protein
MKEVDVLNLCRKGQKLTKTMWISARGTPHVNYHLEPGGVHVSEQIALGLLGRGLFEPTGDGLFEAGTSQTWKIKMKRTGRCHDA